MRAISMLQTKTSKCSTLQIFFCPDLKQLRYKEQFQGGKAVLTAGCLSRCSEGHTKPCHTDVVGGLMGLSQQEKPWGP